jgi:hypothetical protein
LGGRPTRLPFPSPFSAIPAPCGAISESLAADGVWR